MLYYMRKSLLENNLNLSFTAAKSWTSAGQAKCVYSYKPATLWELLNKANILLSEALIWQT